MLEKGKKRKNGVWNIMVHGGWFWFGSRVVFYLGLEKASGEGRTIGLEKEEQWKDRENMKKEEQERNSSV